MSGIQQSVLLIIQTVFGLYSVAVLLRIIMRAANADEYQPLVHGVMKVTDWPVKTLKTWLCDWRQWEIASVLLLLALYVLKAYFISILQSTVPNIVGVLIWAVGSIIHLSLETLFYLVIIRALLSWLPAFQIASIQPLIVSLTEPVMAPARRYVPLLGGFDLSPIALLLAIQVLMLLVANPVLSLGTRVALS